MEQRYIEDTTFEARDFGEEKLSAAAYEHCTFTHCIFLYG